MLSALYKKYNLHFKQPSGTSRGILKTKETWYLFLKENENWGVGECGLLSGLSIDDRPDYEEKLLWVCQNINLNKETLFKQLQEFPSIIIGLETAFASLKSEDKFKIFPSSFTQENAPIPINGLVWMGDKVFMKKQIINKLEEGFTCIKLKIGAIDFQEELNLLKFIRQQFSPSEIEIRVDANGAFSENEALEKLKLLSQFSLHSIEQPIAVKQWQQMAYLCEKSPLAIALDEELIGVFSKKNKENLLQVIKPQYIILKPSFIGGFYGTDQWINLAENYNIGWWVTSALESNIGLNAIAQYTFLKNTTLPQGLGTGGLYSNNINSPLTVSNGTLFYDTNKSWKLTNLNFN